MGRRQIGQEGFGFAADRNSRGSCLHDLAGLIDWAPVERHLAVIEAREHEIHAFNLVGSEAARVTAAAIDAAVARVQAGHTAEAARTLRDMVSSASVGAALERASDVALALAGADGAPVRGFELAGRDGVFCAADAHLEGDSVIVTSPLVAEVSALRYAFRDYVDVNLVNAAGLPARPFRTDP